MGMFDYIKCNVDLPDSPPPEIDLYQSKSLCNTMATFTITEDGRLLKQLWRRVWLRTGELPRYDQRWFYKSKRVVNHPPTRLIVLNAGQLDTRWHGEIYFYAGYPDWQGEWFEYKARFTDGQLDWIRRVPKQAHIWGLDSDAEINATNNNA